MAKLSSDKKYVTVEKGDTLSQIALTYKTESGGKTYQQLAKLNDIDDPNKIFVGEIIKLTGTTPASTSKKNNSKKANVNRFGLQSNDSKTLFATWKWDKNKQTINGKEVNTLENYKTQWHYDTGKGVWFVGADDTTTYKQDTYSIPEGAVRVKFKVKPMAKKKKNKKGEEINERYWTAEWSTEKIYNVPADPPAKPSTPDHTLKGQTLTMSLNNVDTTKVQKVVFKVYEKTTTNGVEKLTRKFKSSDISVPKNGLVSTAWNVSLGKIYRISCIAKKDGLSSEESDKSSDIQTGPASPGDISKCYAYSDTQIYLEWGKANGATKYDIEYANKIDLFNMNSDQVKSVESTDVKKLIDIGADGAGNEWFFRVRAKNDSSEVSGWTAIKSTILGKKPSPPTTWSSTTTAITGEDLVLYWAHNSEDGSNQTAAKIELNVGGTVETLTLTSVSNNNGTVTETIKKANGTVVTTVTKDEKSTTSSLTLDTSIYVEGTQIKWRVQTKGIHKDYSDWSIQRTIDVYAKPTLELAMVDSDNNPINVLTSFPLNITGVAGPNTQEAIGYHLTITANQTYETVDFLGNDAIVSAGQEVYSKYLDISDKNLSLSLTAGDIDLENNESYTISCTVTMNSGLSTEESIDFSVAWIETTSDPTAEISINEDDISVVIQPYCDYFPYYKVQHSSTYYVETEEVIPEIEGYLVEGVSTNNGHEVYEGVDASGTTVYFYIADEPILVENVLLHVYRREYDGRFVKLTDEPVINANRTNIPDPHPALDYARYRIVAVDESTGAVSYTDVSEPIGEKAVIIQWEEQWSTFDVVGDDALEAPPWSGSMLKLPYNIDVSDSNSSDVELVEYIGRQHPVSYYGTQLGVTSTWNVEIEKDDEETLYGLRRLSIWMGDVYVREPSGSGYWANVKVSFSQKHREVTIPVTLSVTRVEGGM